MSHVKKGATLRVQLPALYRLDWTGDEWQTAQDTPPSPTALGIEFVDIPIIPTQQELVRLTFFWTASNQWEGRDYAMTID